MKKLSNCQICRDMLVRLSLNVLVFDAVSSFHKVYKLIQIYLKKEEEGITQIV